MVRNVRGAVTGALELERAQKRIGSSLEAAPTVYVQMDADSIAVLKACDFAEVCITSDITIVEGKGPADAFRLDDLKNVAVVSAKAEGRGERESATHGSQQRQAQARTAGLHQPILSVVSESSLRQKLVARRAGNVGDFAEDCAVDDVAVRVVTIRLIIAHRVSH